MAIYFIQVFIIITVPIIFGFKYCKSINAKKICASVCFITLFLVMGFRSEILGMYDVEYVYLPMLDNVQNLTFVETFFRYPFYRGNSLQLLTKFFTLFSTNQYLWLFLTSLPFLCAINFLIKKYSVSTFTCCFSYFLIMGLRIYGSNFYLIRHSIALALLIFAFDCIIERKLKKFLFLVLLAATFHTTALLFIIAYPFARIKISVKQCIYIVCSFFVITYFAKDILESLLILLSSDNYYTNYIGRTGYTFSIFMFVTLAIFVLAFSIYKINNLQNADNSFASEVDFNKITINILCIACIFMFSSSIVAEFQRVSIYFLTCGIVGFSNILSKEKNIIFRMLATLGVFIILIIFMYNSFEPEMLSPYQSWLF